ncbi:MAG: aspartyl protease family protein [Chitinophagaceae bacterium]
MYHLRKLIFVITLILVQVISFAQEEFITPSQLITRFPFVQFTGGVVLLQARFGVYPDTLNFILDTGSGGISLDSSTAEYFKIKTEPSDKTIRGIAGIRKVNFIYNETLHFPNLTIDSLNFHINDYHILTSVYGEPVDGIIGYSVLNRYIIKLNYDSSYIEFWTKGAMRYPREGFLLKPLITTLPIHGVKVRDARSINSRFLHDIGAGLNLMLSSDFIKDSSLLDKKRKMYTKEAEGLGGKIDMQMTVIKEVRLGPYRFRNVPIYIFDDTYNITSYPYLGGLIGNDLLRRFNVILNYDKRDIYLVPNKYFTDPFDYSYSGIELYLIEGRILVGDVAKGSPAEAAGIKEGDVVVAVNKQFNQNLQQLKTALQAAGQKIKIIVNRHGELLEFEYKVKSIMH